MILWPRVTHFIYALSFACTSVECKWVQKTSSFAPEQNWGTPLTHTSYLIFTHNHVSYVVVGKQQITLMDKILSHAQISEKCKNCYIFWKIVDFSSQIFHFGRQIVSLLWGKLSRFLPAEKNDKYQVCLESTLKPTSLRGIHLPPPMNNWLHFTV